MWRRCPPADKPRSISALAIAGTQSGVGKTSIAIGLMRALCRRGLRVQPFKVGPDFIDPGHHQRATGRVSHNLDGWMLSRETNVEIFQTRCQDCDVAIAEGVMGLFDGYGATTEAGSTAEMVKWLGIPVILVIDASALARSAAALVKGYVEFDPAVQFAGIICNRVGSASHLDRLREAIASVVSIPVLGGIPKTPDVGIPHRHLGLWMSQEDDLGEGYIDRLATLVESHVNLDALLQSAGSFTLSFTPKFALNEVENSKRSPQSTRVRIGIARDEAFCFYYPENLELLQQFGAELVMFSPLRDPLPEDLDGLYFGGGYPELYAEQLSNHLSQPDADGMTLGDRLRQFAGSDRPIYAECGGLMYLSRGLQTEEREYPWVGILPFWTRMGDRLKLGYTEVRIETEDGFFPQSQIARGHRFHYSEIAQSEEHLKTYYQISSWRGDSKTEGYRVGNTLASYVHLHFASNPEFPKGFVEVSARLNC